MLIGTSFKRVKPSFPKGRALVRWQRGVTFLATCGRAGPSGLGEVLRGGAGRVRVVDVHIYIASGTLLFCQAKRDANR